MGAQGITVKSFKNCVRPPLAVYKYSGCRRFLFRWRITENFNVKVLNISVLIYGFLLCAYLMKNLKNGTEQISFKVESNMNSYIVCKLRSTSRPFSLYAMRPRNISALLDASVKDILNSKVLSPCVFLNHRNEPGKGPVELIQRVKIAHSFLQSVTNLFHFVILSLPMSFYIWLSKNFSKRISKSWELTDQTAVWLFSFRIYYWSSVFQ